ncbi:MAG TPA: hypothetical protein VNZ94_00495 [Xanthobacteraceae bacterium]|nr:hypothetical protein [Xanthobacteraceae bacterium]
MLMLGVGPDGKMWPIQISTDGAVNLSGIGTPADEPWDGTGDATVISLLKKIALNTTP